MAKIGNNLDATVSIVNQSSVASAAAAAEAAEIAAASTTNNALTISGMFTPNCGATKATACDATYSAAAATAQGPITSLLVRAPGGGFFGNKGVYACEYTLSTTKDTALGTSMLVGDTCALAGVAPCTPPVQDPADASEATWSATVNFLEAGVEVKRVDVTGAAVDAKHTVWFKTNGKCLDKCHYL